MIARRIITLVAVWCVAQGLMSMFVEHSYGGPIIFAIGVTALIDLFHR
jgi:hypothetical protein